MFLKNLPTELINIIFEYIGIINDVKINNYNRQRNYDLIRKKFY